MVDHFVIDCSIISDDEVLQPRLQGGPKPGVVADSYDVGGGTLVDKWMGGLVANGVGEPHSFYLVDLWSGSVVVVAGVTEKDVVDEASERFWQGDLLAKGDQDHLVQYKISAIFENIG